jgi:hypothetical protein
MDWSIVFQTLRETHPDVSHHAPIQQSSSLGDGGESTPSPGPEVSAGWAEKRLGEALESDEKFNGIRDPDSKMANVKVLFSEG